MRTPTPFQPMHSWPQQQERAWKVPRKLRIKLVNKGGGVIRAFIQPEVAGKFTFSTSLIFEFA